jgi:hypothetical protein
MVANIVIGLISGGIGFWLVKEAYYINHQILFVGWAERKWGSGSGTTFYRLFGIGLIIFGVFTLIGKIDVARAAFGDGKKSESSVVAVDPNTGFVIPPPRPAVQNGRIAP